MTSPSVAPHVVTTRVVEPDSSPSYDRRPYPGLRAFQRDESDLFFGRDHCIDVMMDRLAATRFLAVLGASGSGKSSLVRTGLLDALDMGLHPRVNGRWRVADFMPGAQPVRNLAKALLGSLDDGAPDEIQVDVLESFLRRGPRSILEWAEAGHLPAKSNLLILVDQFEELFRYRDYAQREERDAFVGLLLESALDPNGRVSVVITMRSEYLGACSLMPGLARRIGEGLYLTARMTREECREAIEGPASVIGFGIEPELVNAMLNDLTDLAPWQRAENDEEAEQLAREADQLPLMQHVLNRLWRRADKPAGERVILRLTDYQTIGGVKGALNSHGDQIIEALQARYGPEIESLVERVFRAIVSGPSLALAVRRPLAMRQLLQETEGAPDQVDAIIEAFAAPDCNFLKVSAHEPGLGGAIVDIGHESLIRQWDALSGWFTREVRTGGNWVRLSQSATPESMADLIPLTGPALAFYSAWWREHRPTAGWARRYGGDYEATRDYLKRSSRAHFSALWGRWGIWATMVLLPLLLISGVLLLDRFRELTVFSIRTTQAQQQLAEKLCKAGFRNTEADETEAACIDRLIDEVLSETRQPVMASGVGGGGLGPPPAANPETPSAGSRQEGAR